jgi:hypothetical protein
MERGGWKDGGGLGAAERSLKHRNGDTIIGLHDAVNVNGSIFLYNPLYEQFDLRLSYNQNRGGACTFAERSLV